MATPHQPDDTGTRDHTDSPPVNYDDEAPRVLRVRIAAWDLVCTVALSVLLIVLATATTWPARLFGFLGNVCEGEMCGPVPYGLDMYIQPVVWGGLGAALTAAVVGPVVSVVKGWYMSFWPVLALALIVASSVAGSMLTIFSQRYWL